MDTMVCIVCGKPILSGPVSWDPAEKVATAIGLEFLPRRRDNPALYAENEKKGHQLMLGEPYISSAAGPYHERCVDSMRRA